MPMIPLWTQTALPAFSFKAASVLREERPPATIAFQVGPYLTLGVGRKQHLCEVGNMRCSIAATQRPKTNRSNAGRNRVVALPGNA